jgi:hypothetical protein
VGFEGALGLTFLLLVGNAADWVNPNQPALRICVERNAAPGPALRVVDRSSLQRVPVHVVELLDSLFLDSIR